MVKPNNPATTSIWQVIGASVQGTSHRKQSKPCQDAHQYLALPDGTLLLAIADGAGAAHRSDEGARYAIEQVLGLAQTALRQEQPSTELAWQSLLTKLFEQTHQALCHLAKTEQVSPETFATTLTCAVANDHWLAVGQIGDGVVVAGADDEPLFTAIEPQRGEYANETFFLDTPEVLDYLEIQVYPYPVQHLAAMTDGLLRLAMDVTNYTPHLPFFQPLLTFAAQRQVETGWLQTQLSAFLASERVCARTGDDKTLVLAVRSTD